MTREEAVRLLKQYQGYEPMEYGQVLKHSFDLTDETVDTLLSALTPPTQEQLERVWPGCKMCKTPSIAPPVGFYCPWCGAPRTAEAKTNLRKRLEALNDGKGD